MVVQAAIKAIEEKIDGRVLVRESGTEPLIRIMAEGEDPETIRAAAEIAAARIAKQIGSNH